MEGYFKIEKGLRQGDPVSSLLFVVCMEYLSRVLSKSNSLDQIKFHPICKELKMTHMCFADDLIMCCKGEFSSIYVLLRGFKLFCDSSVMKANANKSAFYSCGMAEEEIHKVVADSRFMKCSMPFKYLGVPIFSKKITKAQCELLIEKIATKITVWSTRKLSYAART